MSHAEGPWDFDARVNERSAQLIQIESLGRGGLAAVLVPAILALLVAALAYGVASRALDRANLAEREARIAQDKYTYVQGELAKKGIYISTDGH